MPIRSMQETALTTRPMRGDTLVVDGVLYVLIRQNGQFGYLRERTFVPLTKGQLKLLPERRAGATTWEVVPEDRERPHPPTPSKKPSDVETSWAVRISWHNSPVKGVKVKAKDEGAAKNKGIAWFAKTNNIPYANAHTYFKTHPQAIEAVQL